MNALWICTILVLVSSVIGEEIAEVKKPEKRGAIGLGGLGYGAHGLGYGGNYLDGHYGLNGFGVGGVGHGYGHGYLNAPSYASLNHVSAPAISHASYVHAPAVNPHVYGGYSHGYQLPLYNSALRYGYTGLAHTGLAHSGLAHGGIGHGYGYGLGHGW